MSGEEQNKPGFGDLVHGYLETSGLSMENLEKRSKFREGRLKDYVGEGVDYVMGLRRDEVIAIIETFEKLFPDEFDFHKQAEVLVAAGFHLIGGTIRGDHVELDHLP